MLFHFFLHIGILICIYAILALGLNIALGYSGLLNLGHIAFYGIGAYSAAVLSRAGFSFWIGLSVGVIFAGICGICLTFITNRLKGDYFAVGTLSFSLVVYAIFLNWVSVTRGPFGIPGIHKPLIFDMLIRSQEQYMVFVFVVVGLVWFMLYRLVNSRYGKLLEGVRDDVVGLSALGKNVYRLKYQAMFVSAAIAGLAGVLYAHYISFIDPSAFYLYDLITVFTIVIVGGLASLHGSVLAAVLVIIIPELLRFLDVPSAMLGPLRLIGYAGFLLIILLFRPRGLFGKVDLE